DRDERAGGEQPVLARGALADEVAVLELFDRSLPGIDRAVVDAAPFPRLVETLHQRLLIVAGALVRLINREPDRERVAERDHPRHGVDPVGGLIEAHQVGAMTPPL